MSEAHELIIKHESPIRPATLVRSTLIQSSLATLKVLGHYDSYVVHLDPEYRDQILGGMSPSWLPIAAGQAHYRACAALQLSDAQLIEIGERVGDRMQGAFMETLTKATRAAGVTPWVLLRRFDVLWGRLFQGGSFELAKIGPKDLTIEIRSASLPQFAYFRQAFCGVVRAGYKYVGVRVAYVRVAQWHPKEDRFVMRAAWV